MSKSGARTSRKEKGPVRESGRDLSRGAFAADPVGAAADQCWSYGLKDNAIDPDPAKNQSASMIPPGGGCVVLSSATIEKGEATFVVCCVKDAAGKCTNCTATVTLQVTRPGGGGGAAVVVAKKVVQITCVKN